MTDFTEINKIYLLLGPQCNMKCRHCSQIPIKSNEKITDVMSDSVWNFLDNYIQFCLQQETNPYSKQGKSIIFWGGEPLLHWDLIKEIISHFTEKYKLTPFNFDKFVFSFVTNGILLDETKVKFLNEHYVKVALSYDAPYPFIARGKISEDTITIANTLRYLSTISTFNAQNCDYYLAARCMTKKFPHRKHSFNFPLLHTFDIPKDLYEYDMEKVKTNLKKLRIATQLGDKQAFTMFHQLTLPLQYPSMNEIFHTYNIRPCASGIHNYSVTLDGNIVTCHNSNEIIGTTEDTKEIIFQRMLEKYQKRSSPFCKTCMVRDICIGNCSFALQDKNKKYILCDKFFIPFYQTVKEELLQVKKPILKEELKWFNKEWEKDDKFIKNF